MNLKSINNRLAALEAKEAATPHDTIYLADWGEFLAQMLTPELVRLCDALEVDFHGNCKVLDDEVVEEFAEKFQHWSAHPEERPTHRWKQGDAW